jgi:hypothetical protein
MPDDIKDQVARRAAGDNRAHERSRAMSESIREGFSAKAQDRAERQLARGIPTKAPIHDTVEDAQMAAAKRRLDKMIAADET